MRRCASIVVEGREVQQNEEEEEETGVGAGKGGEGGAVEECD